MSTDETPQGETLSAPAHGTVADNPEAGSSAEPEQTPPVEDKSVQETPDELSKRLAQLEMRNNQLEKQNTKFEREQEERRLAELSEADRLREELEGYRQKEAYQEAEKFRNTVLEDYLKDDPQALKAAKALIDKNPGNLTWGEGADEEQARSQLQAQLDALKEVIGSVAPSAPATAPEPTASVNPNNPAPLEEQPLDRQKAIDDAARKGDFSTILKTIPSVAAQIKRLTD